MSQMDGGFTRLAVCLALMGALVCQSAAQQPAISRAVEVPAPKGWTPDTPLFTNEVGALASPQPADPVRSAAPKVAKADSPSVVRGSQRKPALVKARAPAGARKTKPTIRARGASSRRIVEPNRRVAASSRKPMGAAQAGKGRAPQKGDARRRAVRGSQG